MRRQRIRGVCEPLTRASALAQGDHALDVAVGDVGAVAVGLVDHEYVGDLQDPCLRHLHGIAPAGGDDHQRRDHRMGDDDPAHPTVAVDDHTPGDDDRPGVG